MDAMGYEFVSLLESLGVFDTELVAKGGLHETASEVEGPEELLSMKKTALHIGGYPSYHNHGSVENGSLQYDRFLLG